MFETCGAGSGCTEGNGSLSRRLLGHVVSSRSLGSMVQMTVSVPGWPGARPGQFAMVQAEPSRCFLARPLSVCDEAGETLAFLIAPIGDGTNELCGLPPEAPVWVLGPLGNGFDLEALARSGRRVVVVAGGVGIAPFPLLLSRLAEHYRHISPSLPGARGGGPAAQPEVLVLLGFRDSRQREGAAAVTGVVSRLPAEGLKCEVEIAVEDGSQGPPARVTDLLRRRLQPGDQVVACGPWGMCEAAWHLGSRAADMEWWFNLETSMACGVGSCHGCVITLADGTYARVCHEGPVFTGRQVFGD